MIEICEHCGAKTKKYWHKLTPGLVKTLVKVYEKISEKQQNIIYKKELKLDHSEYGNFQKLRFHALIAKYKIDGVWDHLSWCITKRGALFIKGEIIIPSKVQTYRNKVLTHNDQLVSITNVIKSDPYWEGYSDFNISFLDEEEKDLEELDKDKTNQNIEIKTVKRKKKGKIYCPKCNNIMKKWIEDIPTENNTVKITQGYICTNDSCNYKLN